MIYSSVSIENVIGRILRNTQLSDMSAMQNMYEWIPEAMELLETQYQLSPEFKDLSISFHQSKLPCGLIILDAVEYNGCRLPLSNTVRPVHAGAPSTNSSQTVQKSIIGYQENHITGNGSFVSTLEELNSRGYAAGEFYYTKLGYLCTSMKTASVRLFYRVPPLDEQGFPLIPDNGNYKEAMYWWVRGKLLGGGYINDSRQDEDSCLRKFELYGARAVGEITYPSIDRMEMIKAHQVRLIAPMNYWESYNRI